MRLAAKWVVTLIVVYIAMIVYWYKAFMAMVTEAKGADIVLFLVLGVASASVGFGVVVCVDKLMDKELSKAIFILASLVMSLVALYVITNRLTVIVTAT
jgi:hypothetical protein